MKIIVSKQIRNQICIAVVFSLTGITLAATGRKLCHPNILKDMTETRATDEKIQNISTCANAVESQVVETEITHENERLDPDILDFSYIASDEDVAQKMLDILAEKDARLFSTLYYSNDNQNSNTSTAVSILNGDNIFVDENSNNKQIVAMANVYFRYNTSVTEDDIIHYITTLWDESHKYRIEQGELYYCTGCKDLDETDSDAILLDETAQDNIETEMEETLATSNIADQPAVEVGPGVKTASISEAEMLVIEETSENEESQSIDNTQPENVPVSEQNGKCPGHQNKKIILNIIDVDAKHNLFALNTDALNINQSPDWEGWTEQNQSYVKTLISQDWKEKYNLNDISGISSATQLSTNELTSYIQMISENENPQRKAIIQQALLSVGRIPYYWGGKASTPGYSGNHFGEIVNKDLQGRCLKGLDCSGWVNWVYWTTFHKRLPWESTAGLVNVGKAVNRDDLKPGDLLIRTGKEAHVVMFLMWADTTHSKLFCIHESSGKVSNVTVSRVDANWQSYRSLFDD